MGRKPCCAKEGVNRGAWTVKEDKILIDYINIHGEGKWRDLPQKAGLNRCGKSCRLRWLNYLRPDIKRGNISVEEEELIMRLHNLLGNRWSLIAGRLPGRTDNEIKNYWNTNLSKRMQAQKTQNSIKQENNLKGKEKIVEPHQVIRTKAVKCTKVVIPWHLDNQIIKKNERESPSTSSPPEGDCNDFLMDFDINDLSIWDVLNLEFSQERSSENANGVYGDYDGMNILFDSELPTYTNDEAMVNINTSTNEEMLDDCKVMIGTIEDWEPEFNALASFLHSEDGCLIAENEQNS